MRNKQENYHKNRKISSNSNYWHDDVLMKAVVVQQWYITQQWATGHIPDGLRFVIVIFIKRSLKSKNYTYITGLLLEMIFIDLRVSPVWR